MKKYSHFCDSLHMYIIYKGERVHTHHIIILEPIRLLDVDISIFLQSTSKQKRDDYVATKECVTVGGVKCLYMCDSARNAALNTSLVIQ